MPAPLLPILGGLAVPSTFATWLAGVTLNTWMVRVFKVAILLVGFNLIFSVLYGMYTLVTTFLNITDELMNIINQPQTYVSDPYNIIEHVNCAMHAMGVWSGIQMVDGLLVGTISLKLSFYVAKWFSIYTYFAYTAYARAVSA